MWQQSSTVAKAREIIQKDGFGLRGLNKGVTATMARNGMFNMIYFSFYHNMKQFIPKNLVRTACFLVLVLKYPLTNYLQCRNHFTVCFRLFSLVLFVRITAS